MFSAGDNSCSLVTLLVFIQALSIVSWGYSLQIKKNYICIHASDRYWGSVCNLLSLRNCEYGIDLFRLIGYSEQKFRYMCLSVVFSV